ncbi:TPA: hypothetical protein ACHQNL_002707 [Serratia marcescens]
MTQTLTTEQLKNLSYSGGIVGDLARELLANREAQPPITDEAIDRIVVPLSPEGLDEEKHHCEWHLYHDRERIRKELREYFSAQPAPANAPAAGYFVRHRSQWDTPSLWSVWTECSAENYAEYCKQIATGEANAGWFFEARVLYDAPQAQANVQPVAWEMRYWNSGHNCWHDWERITAEQHAEMSAEHAADNDYEFRVLYAAPPAPAVVKLPTEFYSDEGIVVRLEEVMAALAVVGVQYERKANAKTRCEFPASEVPEEMTGGIAMSKYKVKKSNYAQWVKGWNACRAAMLAAAPEGGN